MVEVDPVSHIVLNVEQENVQAKATERAKRYLIRFFMDKMKNKNIQSAIGHPYDVLSLLDYIQMTVEEFKLFYRDVSQQMMLPCTTMDKDFMLAILVL